MKLSDLTPNPRNPRKISDEKLSMLGKSLDEFGDISGICFNRNTHHLFGGHQRIKKLPSDAEIVIMQTYDPPTRTGTVAEGHVVVAGEKFHYREVDWDQEKETAAMISANKQGGEWDHPVLSELLLELDQNNFDAELAGYDNKELEKQLTWVSGHQRDIGSHPEPEVQKQFIVTVFLRNEIEMQGFYEEIKGRGMECKLIT